MNPKALRSGDLARLSGVSADTLRYYEHLGILPKSQRTDGGYRIYAANAVQRVQLAQRALQLGFSLPELAEIFRTRDIGGAPCHRVLNLTEQKLRSLGRQIEDLQRTQSYMRKLVNQWRKKLACTPPGRQAMLLQSLAHKPRARAQPERDSFRSRPRP